MSNRLPNTIIEEADQMNRSKKKLRNDMGEFKGETSRVVKKEEWMCDRTSFYGANGKRRTYADLVMHGSDDPYSESEETEDSQSKDSSDEEDQEERGDMLTMSKFQREAIKRVQKKERGNPAFSVKKLHNGTISIEMNKAERKRLEKPWKNALIIKLLGRKVAYEVLKRRLDTIWAKSGGMDLIDLGNNFYVVRLFNDEDYWHVLEGDPWLLFYHYLTIRRWAPEFNPFETSINKVAAWLMRIL
ncbi:hypothetical protein S83_052468 [Arachis hypogaea]